jgi:hypothetical protein
VKEVAADMEKQGLVAEYGNVSIDIEAHAIRVVARTMQTKTAGLFSEKSFAGLPR